MSDFPVLSQAPSQVVISSDGVAAIGDTLPIFGPGTASASSGWPSANLAIFVPFTVAEPFTAAQMFVYNGTTATGNVDAGIYDTGGNRLVSKGSTAQSGTSVLQALDITDTLLLPGLYYMALAMSSTSSTAFKYAPPDVARTRALGLLQMASALALPNPATFAVASNAYVPVFGVTGRSVL